MSDIDKRFFDSLGALITPRQRLLTGELGAARAVVPLDGKVSIGKNNSNSKPTSSYVEAAFIFSKILIQEDGAFELPPNWPTDNTYPQGSFAEEDLPLVGAPSLIQRRVHCFIYYMPSLKEYTVHELLTLYEKPFGAVPIRFPQEGGKFNPVCKLTMDDRFQDSAFQSLLDRLRPSYSF